MRGEVLESHGWRRRRRAGGGVASDVDIRRVELAQELFW